MTRLTARSCQSLKPQPRVKRYSDGQHGLMLAVQPSGSKQWIQRLTIAGKRCDLGLGSYPCIALAEARRLALQNRADVMRGNDPRTPKAPRFEELLDEYVKLHQSKWSPNTAKTKRTQLKKLAPLRRIRVDGIRPEDCLSILRPMYQNGNTTAKATRALLRAILDLAMSKGTIESNPAGEALNAALPAINRQTQHFKALPPSEAPAAYNKLVARSIGALALRFLMLTATRSNEVRGMRWDEVSGDTWTIPAERMKARKPHKVPLSQIALDVLRQAREKSPHGTHVFATNRKDMPLYELAMAQQMKRHRIAGTVHGLRSTFADWAITNGHARDLVSLSLAHSVGNPTTRAYARDTLLDQRRTLMAAWGDYLA